MNIKTNESEWKPANDGPDDETAVLVGFDDGAVWEGYLAAGVWRSNEGLPFNDAPVCWCHMPEVPECFLAAEHRALPVPPADFMAVVDAVEEERKRRAGK